MTKKQKRNLKIHSLFAKQTEIGISYRLLLSKKYISIVYHSYLDKNILHSTLVNYDKNFNIIDSQLVSFDERSDNLLKTTSTIYKNRINLNEYNLKLSKKPTQLVFLISLDGKINRK